MHQRKRAVVGILFAGMVHWSLAQGLVPGTEVAERVTPVKGVDVDMSIWANAGMLNGDITYQIGGAFNMNGVTERTWFPISELEWPLETVIVGVGGVVRFGPSIRISGSLAVNIDDGDGVMKDSDWTDETDTSLKTIYSESDIELQYVMTDVAGHYMVSDLLRNGQLGGLPGVRVALGAGLIYQVADWEASNTAQWYPQNPELGVDVLNSQVNATYRTELTMPYGEVVVIWQGHGVDLEAGFAFAPFCLVTDEDDHRLRSILAETDADGWGYRARVSGQVTLVGQWFLKGAMELLAFEVDGTEEDRIYAGPNTGSRWTIDHEITSQQVSGSLGVGTSF